LISKLLLSITINCRVKTAAEFIEPNPPAVVIDDDPLINLERLICADQDSEFATYYKRYSDGFLRGDDSKFKENFCSAYQAMSLIGMQIPGDYKKIAKYVLLLYYYYYVQGNSKVCAVLLKCCMMIALYIAYSSIQYCRGSSA
jgi:hypothetical protein